jgi:hypothetical protein
MNNTFITSQEIARESLPILKSNLVFANLVHTDFKNDFTNKGTIVQVRKPAPFTAVEFDGDLTGEYQDAVESNVNVALDKIASVDVKVTSQELSTSIQDFNKQIVEPAMVALAEKIDADIAGLYKNVPYTVGAAASTPDAISDITDVRKSLNNNKAPMQERYLVVDPDAEAKFLQIEALTSAEKVGDVKAIREAMIGQRFGFGILMNQNIKTHTIGTLSSGVTASGTSGGTSINISSGGDTKTIVAGDVLTIADVGKFVAAALATTEADGTATVSVYPALPSTFSGKAVTVTASHVANLGFQKNAFAFVCRPLAGAMGGANSYVADFGGLAVRVTMGYDMDTKSNIVSFDCLYGVKCLYPELAVRLLG